MTDTTATVRAQILEDAKAEIDAQKDDATRIRDTCQYMSDPWNFWDDEIDRLQLKKDNLPQTLFHDEIEPTEAEAQALERRLAQWIGGKVPTSAEIGALAIKATSGKLPHVKRIRGTWNTYEPEL